LEKQVVGIFNLSAGEAGSGGCEQMPKTSLIGGKPMAFSKPTENCALQGSRVQGKFVTASRYASKVLCYQKKKEELANKKEKRGD
jgi:hypothetical protein